MELKPATIETVADGAVPEQFARAWDKVLMNIDDPNCDPKAKRSVTITVEIAPNEELSAAVVSSSVKAKLAPMKRHGAVLHLRRREGVLTAYATDPNQMSLDLGDGAGKVTHLERKEG